MTPQWRSPLADQFVLGGLPAAFRAVKPSNVSDDRLAFLMRLRVLPLATARACWPILTLVCKMVFIYYLARLRISATFLGVAGYVIVVQADWLYML